MSRTVTIDVVVATHRPTWGKWPDSENYDLASLRDAPPVERRVTHPDGTVYVMRERFYPVFEAYLATSTPLPSREYYPVINNLLSVDPRVLERQRQQLLRYADLGCKVLWWEHAYSCRLATMEAIRDRFPLRVLAFGDDAPGSSDIKTFPVCAGFNALYHTMLVWDFDRGLMTADQYRQRGLERCYHVPSTASAGLERRCTEMGFDVTRKIERLGAGELAPLLAWVGARSGPAWRQQLLAQMASWPRTTPAGLTTRIHGSGLRDGLLQPFHPGEGDGYTIAPLYADATVGFNLQHSSIFNTRLRDLWRMGVVQIVHDRHGELASIGAEAGVHYVPFDGTGPGLLAAAHAVAADPGRAAEMAAAGLALEMRLRANRSPEATQAAILADRETEIAAAA